MLRAANIYSLMNMFSEILSGKFQNSFQNGKPFNTHGQN